MADVLMGNDGSLVVTAGVELRVYCFRWSAFRRPGCWSVHIGSHVFDAFAVFAAVVDDFGNLVRVPE